MDRHKRSAPRLQAAEGKKRNLMVRYFIQRLFAIRWLHHGLARRLGIARAGLALASLLLIGAVPSVHAYDGAIHQQLTFIAARQFNLCAQNMLAYERFSALETRRMARANIAQADAGFFGRMFRWNYFNAADQEGRRALWMIETRLHDHFAGQVEELQETDNPKQRLKNLGRLINYVQDMTTPSRVVPVYTGRWWRFSTSDRFDRYRVDQALIEDALQDTCAGLGEEQGDFNSILLQTAQATQDAVRSSITGYPATWEVFWEFGREPGDFGEFGPAGNNFGDRTRFRCAESERCLLLEDDPLYVEFAQARHVAAVMATMRVMALVQRLGLPLSVVDETPGS